MRKLNKELGKRLDEVQKLGWDLIEHEKIRYGNHRISTIDVTFVGEQLIRNNQFYIKY